VVEHLPAIRVVAQPAAIEGTATPDDSIVLRLAPDELLVLGNGPVTVPGDAHAIVVADAGWAGVWLEAAAATGFLRHTCEWELPSTRPAFAQGMVANLAVKLWMETDRTLILIPTALAAELAARLQEHA